VLVFQTSDERETVSDMTEIAMMKSKSGGVSAAVEVMAIDTRIENEGNE
jgi:hypothetical protein